jgi:hypothetical protein
MKTVCSILAMAIFLGGSGAQEKKKAHEVHALHDGVLIDPAEKAIFVGKAEGGIEALDITTGTTLWQTNKGDGMRWPVAVYGRTLVVRVRDNPLRIAALDLDAKGKVLWTTDPVLPEWVKGPEWMKNEKPNWIKELERTRERRDEKPGHADRRERKLDMLDKIKGTYQCEEQIEKGEFVMRWRAATVPKTKEGSGVVLVDLEAGKVRTQQLDKDRKIEERFPPSSVEWNGIVFSSAVGKHVGDWVKTYPASRRIVEGHYLLAVDKKTNKIVWERTLWEWGFKETRLVNGG